MSENINMTNESTKSWKSRLQEYCQKNKLPYPNYRHRQTTDTFRHIIFQAEVEINGQAYAGEEDCSTKKDAEQSAAENAYQAICSNSAEASEDVESHFPEEYQQIESFLSELVSGSGGRIRKVQPQGQRGRYRVEIGGGYRFCENIGRQHKKHRVYFLVDPARRVFYQRCYDPECQGFQSARQSLS